MAEVLAVPPLPVPPLPKVPALPAGACLTAVTVTHPAESAGAPHVAVERLPAETDLQYERFTHWLLVPAGVRRSMRRTADHFGVHASTINELADKRDWHARAVEHDKRKVRVAAERAGQLAADSAVSQFALAEELIAQAHELVQRAGEASADDPGAWADLAGQAARVLEKCQRVQRTALGLSTANVSIAISDGRKALTDLRTLSDAELAAYGHAQELVELVETRLKGPLHTSQQLRLAELVAKVAP